MQSHDPVLAQKLRLGLKQIDDQFLIQTVLQIYEKLQQMVQPRYVINSHISNLKNVIIKDSETINVQQAQLLIDMLSSLKEQFQVYGVFMPIAKQYLQKYLNAQIEQEVASKQFYASCTNKQIGVGLHNTHDAGLDTDRISQLNASIRMLQTQAPRTYKYK